MVLLVDTSVWSLAYRRDTPPDSPEVGALRSALVSGDSVATTGIILLELMRGMIPDRVRQSIRDDLSALDYIEPTWADYGAAADLANYCRARGVQLASIDALLVQLAIGHDLTLLSTDRDFPHAARHLPLRLWRAPGR